LTIKVLVADDHQIVREGLRSLLEKKSGLEVIGEAENGRRAVELVRQLKPDVVIMDVSMPDLNGIEATRQINQDFPGAKVLALSMHSDRRFVADILKAGASGYLLKDCAFDELFSAIQAVTHGQIYLSPSITGQVIKDYLRRLAEPHASVVSLLSPREREILQMIAEGKGTKETAARLNVSIKTVETHRRNIMEKLNIHSVAELTKFAVREGLTALEH